MAAEEELDRLQVDHTHLITTVNELRGSLQQEQNGSAMITASPYMLLPPSATEQKMAIIDELERTKSILSTASLEVEKVEHLKTMNEDLQQETKLLTERNK